MNTEVSKPSREELKQRLKMAQMRGQLVRMPKKQREEKVEKLKTQMDEQQKAFTEQLQKLTPEQRKAMGFPENIGAPAPPRISPEQAQTMINGAQIINPENKQPVSESNPMVIPIQIPKMKPVAPAEPVVVNTPGKTLEI